MFIKLKSLIEKKALNFSLSQKMNIFSESGNRKYNHQRKITRDDVAGEFKKATKLIQDVVSETFKQSAEENTLWGQLKWPLVAIGTWSLAALGVFYFKQQDQPKNKSHVQTTNNPVVQNNNKPSQKPGVRQLNLEFSDMANTFDKMTDYDKKIKETKDTIKTLRDPCQVVRELADLIRDLNIIKHEYNPRPCSEGWCLGLFTPHRDRIRGRIQAIEEVKKNYEDDCKYYRLTI